MANMLKQKFSLSLPKVIRGDGLLLFEAPTPEAGVGMVLFLYINFTLSGRNIRGYIAMMRICPRFPSCGTWSTRLSNGSLDRTTLRGVERITVIADRLGAEIGRTPQISETVLERLHSLGAPLGNALLFDTAFVRSRTPVGRCGDGDELRRG